MKTTQILYLFLFIAVVICVVKYTDILDDPSSNEGFNDLPMADPVIARGIREQRLSVQAQPNSSILGSLPFGPYAQTASVGAYQYKDPATIPGVLQQMKALDESINAFLAFEGDSIANSSDPTVSLPLTQLRSDRQRLQQEIAVLNKNPGIDATLTQQDLADIEGSLTFLKRKVRLFQTAGVVSEGFQNMGMHATPKTKATKDDLQNLQNRVYAAILTLSASGTVDPVVQSRLKNLQNMYSEVTDMVSKLDKGIWSDMDIPVYQEDIQTILPSLDNPAAEIKPLTGQGSGVVLNPAEKQLAGFVGEESARDVFKYLKENKMFRLTLDMGYDIPSMGHPSGSGSVSMHKNLGMNDDGSVGATNSLSVGGIKPSRSAHMDSPYDPTMAGMDDRAEVVNKNIRPGHLDWKKRAKGVCEQVRLRGMDPLDFGCIPEGSTLSPAYSWRGHTKMVCGRLGATMDPGLPQTCGCPPPNWKGWTLSDCLSPPPPTGPFGTGSVAKCGANDFN